jgi:biotin operon repressor
MLAEHLGTLRPNVYKAIAGLEEHGLARFSDKKRYARTFVVEPPTALSPLSGGRQRISGSRSAKSGISI